VSLAAALEVARMRVRHVAAAVIAAALVHAPAAARAETYPGRTVTIVAPAAPGGLYSLFAPLVGTRLEQRFGKTFVVENRPGASSVVGATPSFRSNLCRRRS
jgi:tripartite-type tricarboxylate transporter receptor subunit TctC